MDKYYFVVVKNHTNYYIINYLLYKNRNNNNNIVYFINKKIYKSITKNWNRIEIFENYNNFSSIKELLLSHYNPPMPNFYKIVAIF